MVKMETEDGHNYLLLSDCYVPELSLLEAAYPRSPSFFRASQVKFPSSDHGMAWLLSAYARRLAYHWRDDYGGIERVKTLPLETWVIGEPMCSDSGLTDWFVNQPQNYRIILNRMPSKLDGHQLRRPWRYMYWHLACKGRKRIPFQLHHRRGATAHLIPSAEDFLADMLENCRGPTERVRTYLADFGERFWHAQGLPDEKL